MLYESKKDREREARAMQCLSQFFNRPFRKAPSKYHIDFFTVDKGCICEHKYRDYSVLDFKRLGGVWLEVVKYKYLITLAKRRGDIPLFVVSLRTGEVIYADVRQVDTTRTEVAQRAVYRCANDADPCYVVPLSLFRVAKRKEKSEDH